MFIKTRSVVARATEFEAALDVAHRIATHLNSIGIDTEVSTTLFGRPREIHFTSRYATMEDLLGELQKLQSDETYAALFREAAPLMIDGAADTQITIVRDPSKPFDEERLTLL